MPFTPFHIGPATLTYSIFNSLDFIALIYGSILIDVEPFLILLLRLRYNLHGPIHSIVGVLIIAPLIYLATIVTRLILSKMDLSSRKDNRKITLVSILLGGYSHIILDAFLYPDINLAWPLPHWNPLLGIFGFIEVYNFCMLSFIVGLLLCGVRKTLFREKV